jgi:hypothetical protein
MNIWEIKLANRYPEKESEKNKKLWEEVIVYVPFTVI